MKLIISSQFSDFGSLEKHGFARNRMWSIHTNPLPSTTNCPSRVAIDLILKPSKEDLKIFPHSAEKGSLSLKSHSKKLASTKSGLGKAKNGDNNSSHGSFNHLEKDGRSQFGEEGSSGTFSAHIQTSSHPITALSPLSGLPEFSHFGWGHWFTLRGLEVATNYVFSKEIVLGEGGYGVVYKGHLINGSPVAIKKLFNNLSNGSKFPETHNKENVPIPQAPHSVLSDNSDPGSRRRGRGVNVNKQWNVNQTLNDWYDREIDAMNEPYRPIPSVVISENEIFNILEGTTTAQES
ncbi:hypothetical protein ACET3Z_008279 [Daucus carota]